MFNVRLTAVSLTLAASVAVAAAQAPQGATQQPQKPAATAQQPMTTTLVGCLYREAQVPGRTPNVVEKAGVLEDYILADATMSTAQAKPDSSPTATAGTTGTAPSQGNMYKVENIPDERLKALVGKRVQVTGRIDAEPGDAGGAARDRSLGPDQINLPEFEATSIQEVSGGTCPATPAPRSK